MTDVTANNKSTNHAPTNNESTNTEDNVILENTATLANEEIVEGEEALEEDNIEAPNSRKIYHTHKVVLEELGMRIDKIAATIFDDFSRAQLQSWITDGDLTVNGEKQKTKYRVRVEDEIVLDTELKEHRADVPEDIPIDIVYEDDEVLVVNKPVGMVVHPGAGNWTGTLVNALLFHYPEQSHLPRAGLVHRIDKDTSGLLIIAKNKLAQLDLTDQLKDKSVYRHYQCIVAGNSISIKRNKVINAPIGRHKAQRTKMAITEKGKEAVTNITQVTPLSENYSLVDITLETGRTHQIRVHMTHLGFPLVGDKAYGQRQQLRVGLNDTQRQCIIDFPRQALHAYELGFIHPLTGEDVEVSTPMPEDMLKLIEVLKDEAE